MTTPVVSKLSAKMDTCKQNVGKRILGTERTRKSVVLAGQTDHGKSTLVGRMLIDTHSIPREKISQCEAACQARGIPFEPAFLVDALKEEQRELKSINAARMLLRTKVADGSELECLLIDTPGHEEFVTSLVTGAAQADLVLFVVGADEPLTALARKQLHLLSFLGIRELVLFINKIDLVLDAQAATAARTAEIREALVQFPMVIRSVVTGSAKLGLNIVKSEAKSCSPSVLAAISAESIVPSRAAAPFRFWVQDLLRRDSQEAVFVLGTVLCGAVAVGDPLTQYPRESKSRCNGISASGFAAAIAPLPNAAAGMAVALTISPCVGLKRGVLLTKEGELQPIATNEFLATICNLDDAPLKVGQAHALRIGTSETSAKVVCFLPESGQEGNFTPASNQVSLERYCFATARITAASSCILDRVRDVPDAGRFVMSLGGRIVACGLITEPLPPQQK